MVETVAKNLLHVIKLWQFPYPKLAVTTCNTKKGFGSLLKVFFDRNEVWNFETRLNHTLRLEMALHVATRWRLSSFLITQAR